jgi:hypothetical protein
MPVNIRYQNHNNEPNCFTESYLLNRQFINHSPAFELFYHSQLMSIKKLIYAYLLYFLEFNEYSKISIMWIN